MIFSWVDALRQGAANAMIMTMYAVLAQAQCFDRSGTARSTQVSTRRRKSGAGVALCDMLRDVETSRIDLSPFQRFVDVEGSGLRHKLLALTRVRALAARVRRGHQPHRQGAEERPPTARDQLGAQRSPSPQASSARAQASNRARERALLGTFHAGGSRALPAHGAVYVSKTFTSAQGWTDLTILVRRDLKQTCQTRLKTGKGKKTRARDCL